MVVCGHTTLHEQECAEKECPADPGSSPGEGDQYTAAVPRSLGGQDSRFSLSQTHAMHTLIFFARKHPHRASLSTGFDSQLATPGNFTLSC